MRRAALERPRTLRTWRAHNWWVHGRLPTGCICDEQPGRFRKGQRMAGCGRPRCGLCKRAKLYQVPKFRDYRAAVTYREWGSTLGFVVRMPRKHW